MLTRLQLENFRGFKTLNLFPLKRINIIVGQSNTGKTGVLEALTLLLWEQPTRCGNLPNMFRASGGDWNENFWNWLIHGKRKDTSVVIRATFSNGPEFGLRLDSHPPHFPRMGDIVQSLGSLGSLQVFAIGGKETAGVKVSVFSTHPTDPKQDAIDYNRVVLR